MATVVTNEFRNAQMGNPTHSTIDFNADNIRIALIDNLTATVSAGTVDYAELSAALVGTATDLSNETVTNPGIFDASDATIASVSGNPIEQLAVFKWSGTASTSPVTHAYDSATTGIPLTPNGGDVTVTWAGGGILQI